MWIYIIYIYMYRVGIGIFNLSMSTYIYIHGVCVCLIQDNNNSAVRYVCKEFSVWRYHPLRTCNATHRLLLCSLSLLLFLLLFFFLSFVRLSVRSFFLYSDSPQTLTSHMYRKRLLWPLAVIVAIK